MATHTRNAKTYASVEPDIYGNIVVTTVNISNLAHTQLSLSTVKATNAGWVIKTATYSVDGVIHTDSYISDN